ncbi:FadR/GntR family transcriptional regulator [Streptomyces sp. NPDC087908]|uniref:FadR/GntR family transcriptional regulator n=1 Tax=Streptomyces sp. NPDC087908 TaxID=3365820 RepID=UPI00380219F3
MSVDSIPRNTVVDSLEKRLRDDILEGEYPTGSLLPPERELASRYGVTRTTLKHALTRLEQAGMLTTRHGVGSRVRDFLCLGGTELLPMLVARDSGWLTDLLEVRRQVGTLIARRAAARRSRRHTARLGKLLIILAEAPNADAAQLAELEVHRELARATGNRVYLLLTNSLFAVYLPVRFLMRGPFENPQGVADRLARIVRAVERGDAEAAGEAATAYLQITETGILQALRSERGNG